MNEFTGSRTLLLRLIALADKHEDMKHLMSCLLLMLRYCCLRCPRALLSFVLFQGNRLLTMLFSVISEEEEDDPAYQDKLFDFIDALAFLEIDGIQDGFAHQLLLDHLLDFFTSSRVETRICRLVACRIAMLVCLNEASPGHVPLRIHGFHRAKGSVMDYFKESSLFHPASTVASDADVVSCFMALMRLRRTEENATMHDDLYRGIFSEEIMRDAVQPLLEYLQNLDQEVKGKWEPAPVDRLMFEYLHNIVNSNAIDMGLLVPSIMLRYVDILHKYVQQILIAYEKQEDTPQLQRYRFYLAPGSIAFYNLYKTMKVFIRRAPADLLALYCKEHNGFESLFRTFFGSAPAVWEPIPNWNPLLDCPVFAVLVTDLGREVFKRRRELREVGLGVLMDFLGECKKQFRALKPPPLVSMDRHLSASPQ